MSPTSPLPANSIQEIQQVLIECLAEYWAPRFNNHTIDDCARMYAALQPFIRYQTANCPAVNVPNQGN